MIGRRDFITFLGAAAAAWPLAARAQQPERMRRVGLILPLAQDDPETQSRVKAFRYGLRDVDWVEGRNIRIDYRFTGINPTQIKQSVAEMVSLAPDLIVANTTPVLTALRQAEHDSDRIFCGQRSDRSGICFKPGASRRQHHRLLVYRVLNSRKMDRNAERYST